MATRTRLTQRGRIVVAVLAALLVIALLSLMTGGGGGDRQLARGSAPAKLQVVDSFTGEATFYGPGLPADAITASGAPFDPQAATAAHPSLPFFTTLRVTALQDGPSVVVEVNDRLPESDPLRVDLTLGAAQVLGIVDAGRAPVLVEVLDRAAR